MTASFESRVDRVALAGCALAPACLALAHLVNVADAAHDEAVVRALGLGWTGIWRALDMPWSSLLLWLPVGTRAARAAATSAIAAGLAGAALFAIARALLERYEGEERSRLATAVAAIASLSATLAPPWQCEAGAVGGGGLGAVLALAPCAAIAARAPARRPPFPVVALLLGLAVSYEPLVGACALATLVAARFALGDDASVKGWTSPVARVSFALGLVPIAWALTRRLAHASILALDVGALASSAGEHGASGGGYLVPFLRDDVGTVSCLLALAGAVVAWWTPRARGALGPVVAIVVVGYGSLAFGASAGSTRYAPAVLAAIGATYALVALGMYAVVRAVARAPVPFARASAAMIVVLECTFPVRATDDTETRASARVEGAARAWDDAATGALPTGAAVLVADARVQARLLAARAQGELRVDLGLVPLFDLGGRLALRELARDPKLQPVWRDATLLGQESEWSLSSIASTRPLVAPIDPRWERALARHFLPTALFARFEPEPRGASDRRRALDDFTPTRDRLARAIDGDPELLAITATLLRARALALAETSERDVVAHALDDLRPFAPRDPLAMELVKRAAAHPHGAIDVTGLTP